MALLSNALLRTCTVFSLALAGGCPAFGIIGDGAADDAGADDDGGEPLGENAACTCVGEDPCCEAGLFCFAPVLCNVTTDTGCHTEGNCEPLRELGDACALDADCVDDDAVCSNDLCTLPAHTGACLESAAACGFDDDCCSLDCEGGGSGFVRGLCR